MPRLLSGSRPIAAFDPDQPRDGDGRFADKGGSSGSNSDLVREMDANAARHERHAQEQRQHFAHHNQLLETARQRHRAAGPYASPAQEAAAFRPTEKALEMQQIVTAEPMNDRHWKENRAARRNTAAANVARFAGETAKQRSERHAQELNQLHQHHDRLLENARQRHREAGAYDTVAEAEAAFTPQRERLGQDRRIASYDVGDRQDEEKKIAKKAAKAASGK